MKERFVMSFLAVAAFSMITSNAMADLDSWNAEISTANPLNWYKFDEALGTPTCTDSGSDGLDGVYSNVTLAQDGAFGTGTAILFDPSTDSMVYFAGVAPVSSDWTAEYIVKKLSTDEPTFQVLHDDDEFSIRLEGWYTSGEVSFTHYGVADYAFMEIPGESLEVPLQQWSHLVFRKNFEGTQVFINGTMVGTDNNTINCPRDYIGVHYGSTNSNLNAVLDEAIVYNRALTGEEIAQHANALDVITNGLISYWPLDEGQGTYTEDMISNNDGELLVGQGDGIAPTWTDGKFGAALEFDGISSYVDCGSDTSLKPAIVSVSAWVKMDEYSYYGQIAGFAWDLSVEESGYSLLSDNYWISGGSGPSIAMWLSAGADSDGSYYVNTNVPSAPTDWVYVACTYDGAQTFLYVDGIPSGPFTYETGDIDYTYCNTFKIGVYESLSGTGGWWLPYVGLVDDVAVWNRPLSPSEIQWLYNDGYGNPVLAQQEYIEAEIEFKPDFLDLQSNVLSLGCRIRLPQEYDIADVDHDSILLEGLFPATRVWIADERPYLQAKFDLQDLTLEPGEVDLAVSGTMNDGTAFYGVGTITVIE